MTQLDKALKQFNKNPDSAAYFYKLFLSAELFIPQQGINNSESDKISLVVFNKDSEIFTLAYDLLEKFTEAAHKYQLSSLYVAMSGFSYMKTILKTDINVVIINYGFDSAKVFSRYELEKIEKYYAEQKISSFYFRKGEYVRIIDISLIPEELIENLLKLFKKITSYRSKITAVYLAQIEFVGNKEAPHLVLLLSFDGLIQKDRDILYRDIQITVQPYLRKGEIFDIVPDNADDICMAIKELGIFLPL